MHVLRTTRWRGLPAFGFAVAGLLLGHAVAYAIAIPDPLHRDLVLHRTGHAYLPAAGRAALVLALAGVVALLVRAFASGGRDRAGGFLAIARTLVPVQVGAFAGQEVMERFLIGAPLGDLVHDRLLPIGLLVQVLAALLGAAVLDGLARAAARVVREGTGRARSPGLSQPAVASPTVGRPRARVVAWTRSDRAPPSA
jgi:hypothetical protein